MSKRLTLASLFLSTALVPVAAFAQDSGGTASSSAGSQATPPAGQAEEPVEVSVPGGNVSNDAPEIVVTGTRDRNIVRTAPQVVSILSSADIARTGEGDIAGALQRVTGLSVVGSGFVYVRGLGDRYSLALLNGSPLPSPEPLRRVVPLDIFPTDVIASSLVQKSYSVNFPGEFGGGVINLTTKSTPNEPFLTVSGSIGGDTETTGKLGYTYYGSATDFTGFDNGNRSVPKLFANALASGKPIAEGADFTRSQLGLIASSLENAKTTVLQTNNNIPVNFSGDITGGATIALPGGAQLGIIAAVGLSNKWRTRQTTQQVSNDPKLAGGLQSDFNRVITDNRAVANGLLGLALEFDRHKIRFTNLYIRDTVKQSRLGRGTDANAIGRDFLRQDTAWYERQLIDTQVVGELNFDPLKVELRGSYANTQREAPYERSFTYVRTNLPGDPIGNRFVNDLGGNKGSARFAFSDLNETLWSGGIDLSYRALSNLTLGAGYSHSDTKRRTIRRAFQYRANSLPIPVQQLRPDYLVSDYTIQTYGISLIEESAQDGTAAFNSGLAVHGAYGQAVWDVTPTINLTGGVRFERGTQGVQAIDIFKSGIGTQFNTALQRNYYLPALIATIKVRDDMQLRFSGSKTIARPQFRELVRQVYLDTDTNRQLRGNPSLVDTQLTNADARFEWFYARNQNISAAAFYKRLKNPIEAYSSIESSDVTTSFANAPKADLYGFELEGTKYVPLSDWDGAFWQSRRLVLIGNYTFTKSKIKVGAGDATTISRQVLKASDFFRDGAPLTGQSNHLVNLQIGLEDTDKLSQQTLLFSYASDRVTQRGASGQPDVIERPGIKLDFVARQGIDLFGIETELKFEARNITATKYQEFQRAGATRVFYNLYRVGASFSLGLGLKF